MLFVYKCECNTHFCKYCNIIFHGTTPKCWHFDMISGILCTACIKLMANKKYALEFLLGWSLFFFIFCSLFWHLWLWIELLWGDSRFTLLYELYRPSGKLQRCWNSFMSFMERVHKASLQFKNSIKKDILIRLFIFFSV